MKFALAFLAAFLLTCTAYACDRCGGSSGGGCGMGYSSCGDGCGSCGGYSYGGCGSCGGYDSCGDYMSYGGCASGHCPLNAASPQAAPATPAATIVPPVKATIKVHVPADAIVVINGKQTVTTGEDRSYSTRIQPNLIYAYKVVAWVKRDGQWAHEEQMVNISHIQKVTDVAFSLPSDIDIQVAKPVPAKPIEPPTTVAGSDLVAPHK